MQCKRLGAVTGERTGRNRGGWRCWKLECERRRLGFWPSRRGRSYADQELAGTGSRSYAAFRERLNGVGHRPALQETVGHFQENGVYVGRRARMGSHEQVRRDKELD